MNRILVWFSCGAASAVAAKVAVTRYRGERPVEVCYCDTSKDEHPDNARFLADVEKWIGQPVVRLRHQKYRSVEEVFLGERYIVGAYGAACTRCMKREVQEKYARPDDLRVLGFTADERDRIERLVEAYPEQKFLWLLADAGITKDDCYHVLSAAGIELPAMYRLGYGHNNCIGCVKGGKGYWNKIRRDFPEVFARRAAVQRELGVAFNSGGKLYFLDELDPDEGQDVPEPQIECGLFCDRYTTLVDLAVSARKESAC
jgi:hypothetical protein